MTNLSRGYFEVEVDLDTTDYDGKIIPYDETVPTFIENFLTGLTSKTSRTVTALAPELLMPFGNWIYAYDLGDAGSRKPPPVPTLIVANLIFVGLSDLAGAGTSLAAAIACLAIIDATGSRTI